MIDPSVQLPYASEMTNFVLAPPIRLTNEEWSLILTSLAVTTKSGGDSKSFSLFLKIKEQTQLPDPDDAAVVQLQEQVARELLG